MTHYEGTRERERRIHIAVHGQSAQRRHKPQATKAPRSESTGPN